MNNNSNKTVVKISDIKGFFYNNDTTKKKYNLYLPDIYRLSLFDKDIFEFHELFLLQSDLLENLTEEKLNNIPNFINIKNKFFDKFEEKKDINNFIRDNKHLYIGNSNNFNVFLNYFGVINYLILKKFLDNKESVIEKIIFTSYNNISEPLMVPVEIYNLYESSTEFLYDKLTENGVKELSFFDHISQYVIKSNDIDNFIINNKIEISINNDEISLEDKSQNLYDKNYKKIFNITKLIDLLDNRSSDIEKKLNSLNEEKYELNSFIKKFDKFKDVIIKNFNNQYANI